MHDEIAATSGIPSLDVRMAASPPRAAHAGRAQQRSPGLNHRWHTRRDHPPGAGILLRIVCNLTGVIADRHRSSGYPAVKAHRRRKRERAARAGQSRNHQVPSHRPSCDEVSSRLWSSPDHLATHRPSQSRPERRPPQRSLTGAAPSSAGDLTWVVTPPPAQICGSCRPPTGSRPPHRPLARRGVRHRRREGDGARCAHRHRRGPSDVGQVRLSAAVRAPRQRARPTDSDRSSPDSRSFAAATAHPRRRSETRGPIRESHQTSYPPPTKCRPARTI